MGIKNFSKVFKETRVVKPNDLAGKTIAMDAASEIYRASLGAKSVSTLTDSAGNPTLHITVILSNILEFHRNNVNQIWVFDHDQDPNKEFHNPAKLGELVKRRKKRDVAMKEMMTLKDFKKEEPMFSDSEDEADDISETKVDPANRISTLEKRVFKLEKFMVDDVKLILNCLGIKYIEAPAGFEGECIGSYLTTIDKAYAIYSGDTDPIAYGANVLLRRNPKDKKIYEYTRDDILKQIDEKSMVEDPDIDTIRKIAMILGTDVSEKTPGIGAMTVLKKVHNTELTDVQIEAMKEFEKIPDDDLVIINDDKIPFADKDNIVALIDWLVEVKSFNRTRIQAQFDKEPAKKKAAAKKAAPAKKKALAGIKESAKKASPKKKETVMPPKRGSRKVVQDLSD